VALIFGSVAQAGQKALECEGFSFCARGALSRVSAPKGGKNSRDQDA
jgi:hypothetical protein